MNNIAEIEKKLCCGCRTCELICPVSCVNMEYDDEGFLYPHLDFGKCLNCGECLRKCPSLNVKSSAKSLGDIRIFGAKNKSDKIRFNSSSGGVFAALAKYVIKKNGLVFGATIDSDGRIYHRFIEKEDEIKLLQKSKYVQSDIGKTYEEAKRFLNENRWVLFSGTPCQISGLYSYLGVRPDKLYTVDVVCTGASSPGVWKSYIEDLEADAGSKVNSIEFRHKKIDYINLMPYMRNLTMLVEFENGQSLYQYYDKNEMFGGFIEKLFLRDVCANCRYKSFSSGSDIQLGDFWELEKICPEALDVSQEGYRIPFGISEVIVLSKKGQLLFDSIKDDLEWFETDVYETQKAQSDANWFLIENSAVPHWNRTAFFGEYKNNPNNIREIIKKNIGIRNIEKFPKCRIGLWGSYNLRCAVKEIERYTGSSLIFQYRNETICSSLSAPYNSGDKQIILSDNSFRAEMQRKDMEKDFMMHLEERLRNIDLFVFDLLEERYQTMINGCAILTKSEGFMESSGIEGVPYIEEFIDWCENIDEFIRRIESLIGIPKMVMVESFMSLRYGKNLQAPKYSYHEENRIQYINEILEKKYEYIKKNYSGLLVIDRLPDVLQFSETEHAYGCLPEHTNGAAYKYMAQEIINGVLLSRKEYV